MTQRELVQASLARAGVDRGCYAPRKPPAGPLTDRELLARALYETSTSVGGYQPYYETVPWHVVGQGLMLERADRMLRKINEWKNEGTS